MKIQLSLLPPAEVTHNRDDNGSQEEKDEEGDGDQRSYDELRMKQTRWHQRREVYICLKEDIEV